jgi:hypothetical protein
VVDWENGMAMAVDSTTFWSIYAARITIAASTDRDAELIDAQELAANAAPEI